MRELLIVLLFVPAAIVSALEPVRFEAFAAVDVEAPLVGFYGEPINLEAYEPAPRVPIVPLANVSIESPSVPRVEPPAGWIEVDERIRCDTCPGGWFYTGRTIRVPAPSAPTKGVGQPSAASECPCIAANGYCPCAATAQAPRVEASCGSDRSTVAAPMVKVTAYETRRGRFGRVYSVPVTKWMPASEAVAMQSARSTRNVANCAACGY